jgi:hypothetical protein
MEWHRSGLPAGIVTAGIEYRQALEAHDDRDCDRAKSFLGRFGGGEVHTYQICETQPH